MPSPLRPRNVVIFLLINIMISALTAFIVVRAVTQAANRALVAPASAESAPGPAPAGVASADAVAPTLPTVAAAPTAMDASVLVPANPAPVEPTVAPTVPPTAAQAASPAAGAVAAAGEPANVRISTVVFPGQRTREAVVIVNEGEQVNMTGWTLSNPRGETYTFGNVLLFRDSFINLHTTSGVDVPTDVFWNLDQPVWQAGDVATLKRGDEVMATFTVR